MVRERCAAKSRGVNWPFHVDGLRLLRLFTSLTVIAEESEMNQNPVRGL